MSGQVLKFDDSAHRSVDASLPWFVNGTLERDEAAAVERHLRECARCRREVDLLRQLHVVCATGDPAPDPTPSYRQLHERIARRRWPVSLADCVRDLFGSWQRAPAWTKWAIAVEFAAIVMVAPRIVAPIGESPAPYRTLGAPDTRVTPDHTMAVVFAAQTPESELRRIVRTAGARVVDGPTESNAYVLEIPAGRRAAALAALRAEPAVVLAQPLTGQPE